MSDHPLKLDATKSDVRIQTHAKGLLSALAHDLEIRVTELQGQADESRGSASVTAAVSGLKVVGSIKHGRVDTTVLSAGDIADIERKIRNEVLTRAEVTVDATLDGRRGTLRVKGPGGTATVRTDVDVSTEPDGGRVVRGRCKLSLHELGVREVKGPLGAFKIDDAVDLIFTVRFA